MTGNRVSVKIRSEKDSEDLYFAKRDQDSLRELRKKAAEQSTKKYCEEHKYHCFRCGAQSLVEIDEGSVKIDICVNKNCGAIHLDPGELSKIIKDHGALSAVRKSFLAVFK